MKNSATPRGQWSLPLMPTRTKTSSGKKRCMRISTPTQRPSGIDQPRMYSIVVRGAAASSMLGSDARDCRGVPVAGAGGAAGPGHAADERPAARDAVQRAGAADCGSAGFWICMRAQARWASRL